MNFVNEYALLVAVALPVVAIVGFQVYLFVCGDRAFAEPSNDEMERQAA